MKPLMTLLKSDKAQVDTLSIEQVLALCGTGKLVDGSETCDQFREYLQIADSQNLFKYAENCLHGSFDRSGFVLQDIVNEFGRRLDYSVENGLYQGKSNTIGYDGLWTAPDGHVIVVEVKTTDAYRINLDTIAQYRNRLIENSSIIQNSSVLLVVGRQDTGDLEAQVRGSKHAWTFRIISVDALARLVSLKENAELSSVSKIHDLLTPFEYTRLDKIIDLAFTVAEDVTSAAEIEQLELANTDVLEDSAKNGVHERVPYSPTPKTVADQLREEIILALVPKFGPLIKKSRALYWTANKLTRAVIAISKEYEHGNFWYGYHPDWDIFLSQGATGLFVLGCVGKDKAFAIPYEWIHSRLEHLNVTESENHRHYHIHLYPSLNGKLSLRLNNGQSVNIENFELALVS